jgi:hypothetical protein
MDLFNTRLVIEQVLQKKALMRKSGAKRRQHQGLSFKGETYGQ